MANLNGDSSSAATPAVLGENTASGGVGVSGLCASGDGVHGESKSSRGVVGVSVTSQGIYGKSRDNGGVVGESKSGEGIRGVGHGGQAGVVGINDWAPPTGPLAPPDRTLDGG